MSSETRGDPRLKAALASEVYDRLRQQILDGSLEPGSTITLGPTSEALGVSRTPVREALRRLHGEGLVDFERYRRPRVAGFDPGELDSLYASRIVLESLAIATSTPLLTDEDLDELDRALDEMEKLESLDTLVLWEDRHREFHELLISPAINLAPQIRDLVDRSYRYRHVIYANEATHERWLIGRDDHKKLVAACRERDASKSVRALAGHLARTALVMMSVISPASEPVLTRTALKIVTHVDA